MMTYHVKMLLILSGSLMAIALTVLLIDINLLLAGTDSPLGKPTVNLNSMSASLMALSPRTASYFPFGCHCPTCLAAATATI